MLAIHCQEKGAGTILCQFPKYISRTHFRKFSINTLMTIWTDVSMWVPGFAWRDNHYYPLDLDHHHHHHYRQQQLRYRCEFLGWVCAHGDADHIVGVWGDGQRYQCMNPSGLWPVFILKRTWGFQIRRWTFLINFVGKRGDDTSKVGLCSMHPVCSFEGEGSQRFISCSQEEIREVLGTWRECRRNTEEANTNTFWRRNKSLRSGWEIWPTMLPKLQTHKLALSKRKRNM